METIKETDIQNTICEYLAMKRRCFWRNNSYGIYSVAGGFHRKLPKYSMKGVPDIIVIQGGTFVGLEVKTPKGRQSPEQKEFEKLVTKHGGRYHVVRSLEEVIAIGL